MSTDKKEDLFQISVLHRDPNNKNATTEVLPLQSLLARNAESARVKAIRLIPADWDDKLDELEVVVRPF